MPSFAVTNTLIITDPCSLESGNDHAGLTLSDCGGIWEARVADEKLSLTRIGAVATSSAREEGSVLVDTGMVCVVDARSLDELLLDEPYFEILDEAAMCADAGVGLLDSIAGLATYTAFGDGGYPITATRDSQGRPARIVVDFNPPFA